MLRRTAGFAVAALAFLAGATGDVCAQTVGPRKVFGRYQQTVWEEQDGLPQNTVLSMTRTRDGYLWLGTHDGVARFDGVRFTNYNSTNTPALGGTLVIAVLEDRAGALWMGTDNGGLTRYARGRFTRYTTADGLADDHVTGLLEDRRGTLWIATESGLVARTGDRFVRYARSDGLPSERVTALAEDVDGALWIGTSSGLARLQEGRFTSYTTKDGLPSDDITALASDGAGALWVGTGDAGVCRFSSRGATSIGAADARTLEVRALFLTRDHDLWIGTGSRGLYRLAGDRLSSYTTREGLPADHIRSIYQDPEGDVWVGTAGGLVRFRDGRVKVHTVDDGLASNEARAIVQSASGDVWIGSSVGVTRLTGGRARVYTTADGLPSQRIVSFAFDRAGRLHAVGARGVAVFEGRRFVPVPLLGASPQAFIRTVFFDRSGRLWVGTTDDGVWVSGPDGVAHYTRANGLGDDYIMTIFEDRAGDVWLGTLRGGMSRIRKGTVRTWTTRDGLGNDQVLTFHEDREGMFWVGTHGGGLTRVKQERLASIGTRQGLFNDVVFRILEDDRGNFWMSCNKGIFRVRLEDLNAVADGRLASLASVAYGIEDGMLSAECNGADPAGWKMQDGTLWFPTIAGAAVIDPRQPAPSPPRVAIERVTVNRSAVDPVAPVEVRPGQENLEIEYTAFGWSRPQHIRFRYRLEGLDRDWIDAGARRTAYYSYLPPGRYHFAVAADIGGGLWNGAAQRLAVTVLPAFYQALWFRVVWALALIGAVAAAWRMRTRQFARAQGVQRAFSQQLIASQERERKRIAGELHDSLGQYLVLIRNSALLSLDDDAAHGARQSLQEISAQASSALGEVREIAYNLRPYQLDRLGLTKAIEAIVTAASKTSPTVFTSTLDDIDDAVPKDRAIDVYRIVQEAVNNIVKHAHATKAEVRAERTESRLRLTIEDNGRGFTPGAARTERGAGGFGLLGLSERADLLGGGLTVVASPGRGTRITLDVPLAAAAPAAVLAEQTPRA